MTKSKFYLITLLTVIVLSVVLGSSSSFASDISSINQMGATISVPLTQWNELKSNNEKALNLIEVSNVPLTEVQNLATKQHDELNKAKNTIDSLTSELEKAKADLVKQETTLNEMQNSLTELKGTIERDNRTIKRLKRQRNLSQVIGAGAIIGIAISR